MYLEIVTPEKVVLKGEVESFSVPGINGEFQVLNNHAPVVSVLTGGFVKVATNMQFETSVEKDEENRYRFAISGGVLEINNNKAIVLAD
ncbi:MAG: F0F1 ATP synthase subunit epsilon [Mesonia hippocampi]|uniref:F0F1 ATP synthase subunit epsilon n=1 Tax=Mesonia hippocampi TaxID=1628250 RepID=UPI003F9452FE